MKLCRGLKISDDDRHLMTLGAFGCESSSGLTATQASETIDVLVAAKSSDEFDVINSAIARGRSGQPAKQTTG